MRTAKARKIIRNAAGHTPDAVAEAVATLVTSAGRADDAGKPATPSLISAIWAAVTATIVTSLLSSLVSEVSTALARSRPQSAVDLLLSSHDLYVQYFAVSLMGLSLLWYLYSRIFQNTRPLTPVVIATSFLAALVAYSWVTRGNESELATRKESAAALVKNEHWIAYDPQEFDPHLGVFPSEDSIRRDLKALREFGFSGIITFSNQDTLGRIPYIADTLGLKVILGVWLNEGSDIPDDYERDAAIKAAKAGVIDAICVGHTRGEASQLELLAEFMAELRDATALPVSHSEPIDNYIGERGTVLRTMGDWYFPIVGNQWRPLDSAEEALSQFRQEIRLAAQLPADKPVLLKLVGFPSRKTGDTSVPDPQLTFFRGFLQNPDLPRNVSPSFAFAFDNRFAGRRASFRPDDRDPSEERLGLLTSEIEPRGKPAMAELNRSWRMLTPDPTVPTGEYIIEPSTESNEDSREWRLYSGQENAKFHFASILWTAAGSIVLRPHPELRDPNGWGPSVYVAAFLSHSDSRGADVPSLNVVDDIIVVSATGQLDNGAEADSIGSQEIALRLGYDRGLQRMVCTADVRISLVDSGTPIEADLNILRVHTNLVRKTGGEFQLDIFSGDSSGIEWAIPGNEGERLEFGFFPTSAMPSNYATDSPSRTMEVFVHGNPTAQDGENGELKQTPNVRIKLNSPESPMIFGAHWDADNNTAFANNVSVTPIVLKEHLVKPITFRYSIEASAPVTE